MKHTILRVKFAYQRFRTTPRNVQNWMAWGIRRMLLPRFTLFCWVSFGNGTRFFLGRDVIDDRILEDITRPDRNIYLPYGISHDEEMTILDIGGHHGLIAVYYAAAFPNSSIITVEPDPEAIQYIEKNVRANNLGGRIEILNAALASEDGEIDFYVGSASWSSSTSRLENPTRMLRVPSYNLKSITKGREITLIKCNAEGAEYYLIPQILSEDVKPKYLVIMIHPEHGNSETIVNRLRQSGYFVSQIAGSAERPIYHCINTSTGSMHDIGGLDCS